MSSLTDHSYHVAKSNVWDTCKMDRSIFRCRFRPKLSRLNLKTEEEHDYQLIFRRNSRPILAPLRNPISFIIKRENEFPCVKSLEEAKKK